MDQGNHVFIGNEVLAAEVYSTWPPARSCFYRCVKRMMDVGVSALLLFFIWPFLVMLGIAIYLTSGWPVLFRQTRAGKEGREFTLYKFRSMVHGIWDDDHREIVRKQIFSDHARRRRRQCFVGQEKRKSDFKDIPAGRLTGIGRFMRKTGLDELPQLWNVLVGDMSLVGPRPPIPYELPYCPEEQRRRLAVVPGITGLWQASGWSQLNYAEMIQLDLSYIERQSFWLDLQILAQTPAALFASWRTRGNV